MALRKMLMRARTEVDMSHNEDEDEEFSGTKSEATASSPRLRRALGKTGRTKTQDELESALNEMEDEDYARLTKPANPGGGRLKQLLNTPKRNIRSSRRDLLRHIIKMGRGSQDQLGDGLGEKLFFIRRNGLDQLLLQLVNFVAVNRPENPRLAMARLLAEHCGPHELAEVGLSMGKDGLELTKNAGPFANLADHFDEQAEKENSTSDSEAENGADADSGTLDAGAMGDGTGDPATAAKGYVHALTSRVTSSPAPYYIRYLTARVKQRLEQTSPQELSSALNISSRKSSSVGIEA